MKSFLKLWNSIYVYQNISAIKKKRIYLTRNKVKSLKKVISNPYIVDAILDNEIVRVKDGVPMAAAIILIEKFGFHVSRYIIFNPDIL